MVQCVVLNISEIDEWRHQLIPHGKFHPGIYIPKDQQPGLIHPTREDAEKEAVRLACNTGGKFAVLELIGTVTGQPLGDSALVTGLGPFAARVPRWETEKVEI